MRKTLLDKLWRGSDPYAAYQAGDVDIQGWDGSDHPWLAETILELKPTLVVEVGVWKGASVLTMADALWRASVDDNGKPISEPGVILAIDTWLGSFEHWLGEDQLPMSIGRPVLYDTFIRNVVAAELQEYVVPLPLDSVNAAMACRLLDACPDMVHLDGAHDERSVATDLGMWWSLLRDGGVMIIDDYDASGVVWPSVRTVVDAFAAHQGVAIEASFPKARLRKSA